MVSEEEYTRLGDGRWSAAALEYVSRFQAACMQMSGLHRDRSRRSSTTWKFQVNVECHANLACIRMVVRIMLMVPIYAISSLISLFSLEAAFVIDAIRDIYEVCRASSKLPYSVTMASTGIRNLLLFPTTSRISWWGAFAPHSSAWPPTQSYPLSHEYLPTRARHQRPLHIFIPQTRDSPYVRHLHTALTF